MNESMEHNGNVDKDMELDRIAVKPEAVEYAMAEMSYL